MEASQHNYEKWRAFLAELVGHYRGRLHAPGILAGLVTAEGLVAQVGESEASLEAPGALSFDTPIRAGSISKLMTAVGVLQCVEAGKLSLETEIGSLVDWQLPHGYGKATVGQLMSHQAGIGERFSGQATRDAQQLLKLEQYLQVTLPPPLPGIGVGDSITYSNFGISLAALAVEKVTGQTFEAYAQEHIFKPLGMDGATFIPDAALEKDMAEGYKFALNKHFHLPLRHWRPYPASSLVVRMEALSRFMADLLSPDSRLLSKPKALWAEQRTLVEGVPGMGIGFWLTRLYDQPVAWHTGHMPGHRTGFYLFPEAGFGVLLYYNIDEKILRPFLDDVARFAFAVGWEFKRPEINATTKPALSSLYRHSWYPHHHFGKCAAISGMEGEQSTAKLRDGSLIWNGHQYAPVSRGVFINTQSGELLGLNNKLEIYLGGRDRLEVISPLENRKLDMGILIASFIFFLLMVPTAGVSLFFVDGVAAKSLLVLLLCVSISHCSYFISLAMVMASGIYKVMQDMPPALGVVLGIPYVGLALAIPLWLLVFNAANGYLLLLSLVVLVWQLVHLCVLRYWNLCGWRY